MILRTPLTRSCGGSARLAQLQHFCECLELLLERKIGFRRTWLALGLQFLQRTFGQYTCITTAGPSAQNEIADVQRVESTEPSSQSFRAPAGITGRVDIHQPPREESRQEPQRRSSNLTFRTYPRNRRMLLIAARPRKGSPGPLALVLARIARRAAG